VQPTAPEKNQEHRKVHRGIACGIDSWQRADILLSCNRRDSLPFVDPKATLFNEEEEDMRKLYRIFKLAVHLLTNKVHQIEKRIDL